MSTPEQCNHCSLSGWACPRHATDLNYPAGGFPDDEPFAGGVDELGFAGHAAGGPFPWLAEEPAQGDLHPARPGYGFSDLLRSAGDPSRIQFTLNWGSSEEGSPFRDLPPAEAPVNGMLTSGSKMSLPWNTPASNSSESAKEAEDVITNIEPQVVDTTMDREARVQRYKEKKKRRKFEKQIRYASRKAYAEMRPRVKGRFAKATDASQASSMPAYTPQPFDMGWFRP